MSVVVGKNDGELVGAPGRTLIGIGIRFEKLQVTTLTLDGQPIGYSLVMADTDARELLDGLRSILEGGD